MVDKGQWACRRTGGTAAVSPTRFSPGSIVVGVDGSALSTAAIQWSARRASDLGLPIHLVHACKHRSRGRLRRHRPRCARRGAALAMLRPASATPTPSTPSLEVSTACVSGFASPTLIQVSHKAAMVVDRCGRPRHHQPGLDRPDDAPGGDERALPRRRHRPRGPDDGLHPRPRRRRRRRLRREPRAPSPRRSTGRRCAVPSSRSSTPGSRASVPATAGSPPPPSAGRPTRVTSRGRRGQDRRPRRALTPTSPSPTRSSRATRSRALGEHSQRGRPRHRRPPRSRRLPRAADRARSRCGSWAAPRARSSSRPRPPDALPGRRAFGPRPGSVPRRAEPELVEDERPTPTRSAPTRHSGRCGRRARRRSRSAAGWAARAPRSSPWPVAGPPTSRARCRTPGCRAGSSSRGWRGSRRAARFS